MSVPKKMVALGDSIGYGLSAYPDRANRDRSTLCGFNDQIAAYLGISGDCYANLSCPGDRANDMLTKLERADDQAIIREADILTVSMGGNNLLGPGHDAICRLWGLNPADYFHAPDRSIYMDLKQIVAEKSAANPGYNPEQDFLRLANLRDPAGMALRLALIRGIFAFSRSWPKIISQLRQLNSRAALFVTTVHSPSENGNPADRFHPFYVAIDALANAINRVIRKNARNGAYQIIDLCQAFRSNPEALTFDLGGALNAASRLTQTDPQSGEYPEIMLDFLECSDIHPCYAGHVIAFNQFRQVWEKHFKEEIPMDERNKAHENLSRLKDVRIIYLPPCTVAASHYVGDEPEWHADALMKKFVRESSLYQIKPDLRHFGFNHPNPVGNSPDHGYEMWVTIPDDMDVPPPLVKKHFAGGLYAAHMIAMGDFHEWQWLFEWVTKDNPKYVANNLNDGGECMYGLLEEHLNYINHVNLPESEPDGMQLDLLYPVKPR